MAPSANATIDFARDQLLRMAFQLTGTLGAGKEPGAADLEMGSDFMNLELMALQAEGIVLRTVERVLLPLVSGTAQYTLAADTMDVALGPNDQAGTIVQASGAEVLVTSMARAEYLDLSDKSPTVAGVPTRVFIERQALINLVFWPVPNDNTLQFRYARVRLLRDMDTGGVTTDLNRRWLLYVAYAVAAHLARAKSVPAADVADLTQQAARFKAICKADDNQRGKIRFRMAHKGRNW